MAKNVNIHVKTPGAKQAEQDLNKTGKAAKGVGDKTAEGQRRAGDSTEKTTQKLSGMGRLLANLKSQVMGYVGAFLGLTAVVKLVGVLHDRLQQIQQLQKQIYEQSLSLLEVGQGLELQTGTMGRQQYWANQALALQKAGGLVSPNVAQQMMISADIAFGDQGGIKNRAIRQLLMGIAPTLGAAGLGGEEVGKFFEFAGIAGVAPTAEAYKGFFAKVLAGYTTSKATDFGQFLTAMQKGGTAYMTQGGSLNEAISRLVGVRAVTPTEPLAATMLEQMSRLASGAYEKPRKAMEGAMGVEWGGLSMDERMQTMLDYIAGIPEEQRAQVLSRAGFPIELITQLGKAVSPEAVAAQRAAGQAVAVAGPEKVRQFTEAYMGSILARSRAGVAGRAAETLRAGPSFASWQERLKNAQARFDILRSTGDDRLMIPDWAEPRIMALEGILADLDAFALGAPEGLRPDIVQLRENLSRQITLAKITPSTIGAVGGMYSAGFAFSQVLQTMEQAYGPPININHVYDNSMKFTPVVGEPPIGPRVGNDDIY